MSTQSNPFLLKKQLQEKISKIPKSRRQDFAIALFNLIDDFTEV